MFKNLLSSMFLMALLISPTWAEESIAAKYMNNPEVVGKTRMTYLFWDVYDATLYAPSGQWGNEQPYSLTLAYLRNLKGKDIAKRSVEEMRQQGVNDEAILNKWLQIMEKMFPDVEKGSTITGVRDKTGASVFYFNGKEIGRIEDKAFTQKFFDIWLNEKTSEPNLRKKLMGLTT